MSGPARRRGAASRLPAALLVALAAAAPYFATGGLRTFVPLDDPQMVLESPGVMGGITAAGVRWALTSTEWGNWHPLTLLSHMLDVQLFGVDAWWHHTTSVALHAAAAALLFLALARLTGAAGPSLLAALVFGVHPLRVESVAWIAERKDVLAGLCFALVLLAWERYAREGGGRRYAVAAALLALGLAAKPTLVTVPALLLLLDLWPLGRWRPADGSRRLGLLLAEKAPLFALAAASSTTVYLTQRASGGMASVAPGAGARLANAVISYGSYLGDTFWPAGLAVYYPYPPATDWARFAPAAAALAAVSALAWRLRRRQPWVGVGWLWFLGMLVPLIGVVQVGAQAMADRATHLPGIGLALAVAWCGGAVTRERGRARTTLLSLAAAALLLLASATVAQVGRWRDGESILRHSLAVTTGNWLLHNNLGSLLAEEGQLEEAVAHFEESLRIGPGNADALLNLGLAFERLGRFPEAARAYRGALRLEPPPLAAYERLADLAWREGRDDLAVDLLRAAAALDPGYPLWQAQLGRLALSEGRAGEALLHLRRAVALDPGDADLRRLLLAAAARTGTAEPGPAAGMPP